MHEPGAEFRYSNEGMPRRLSIIERVSGMSASTTRTKALVGRMTSTGSLSRERDGAESLDGICVAQRRVDPQHRHVAVERHRSRRRLF